MIQLARALLYVVALIAMTLGAMNILLGPQLTAEFWQVVWGWFIPGTLYTDALKTPSMDSELRFYSVFWVAYAGVIFWALREGLRGRTLSLLAGLFFLGGVARALSWVMVGAPDILFQLMMWIELAIPPLIAGLLYAGRRHW
ncbi:MAG: DUF4345 domain-containing protein [Maritimibacter sp.]